MIPAILFDRGPMGVEGGLAPLTDLRATFDVRTGALTPAERIAASMHLKLAALVCPDSVAAITGEHHTVCINPPSLPEGGSLVINGRWPACDTAKLARLAPGEAVAERGTGEVLAARVESAAAARRVIEGDALGLKVVDWPDEAGNRLLRRPWDVRRSRDWAIALDLVALGRLEPAMSETPPGVTLLGGHAARIHKTANVYPTAVLDCEQGAIVVDEHAVVRPGAIICGPAYVGPRSTVLDHALVKPNTAIGPVCKVAGEVGGTIFQGFANKAHDGHLGDSWVGQWANLGAGTTNSNLLNTYGEVVARALPGGSNERTGEVFLGAIIGDHVRTAICTRIMTGAVMHTGVMWAAGAPAAGAIGPFSWVTDAGVRPYRFDKFMEVARAAMGRRGVTPGAAYERLLRDLSGADARV